MLGFQKYDLNYYCTTNIIIGVYIMNTNASYEKFSFYNNVFSGVIENDCIFSTDFYGNRQQVGVSNKKHQETLDLLKSYYDKLVDAGIIVKEKTPEEIMHEQNALMQQLVVQVSQLQSELKTIKGVKEDEYTADNSSSCSKRSK